MAAGSFVSEDIDQLRKCAQDILTMLSENGDAEKASKETSYFTSETVNAQTLEKRWFKLLTQSYHIYSCGTHMKYTTACLNTLSDVTIFDQ